MDAQPWHSLGPFIEAAGAEPVRSLAILRRYATLVIGWNRNVSNLISKNDEARLVERHLAESLEPASWLKRSGCSTWMDLGSGAGFPAVPLAVVGVGDRWVLVESRRPKTLFLRNTLSELGLYGISIAHSRLERLGPEAAHFDGFTARATQRLGVTLALAAPRVGPKGRAFLWKGSRWQRELRESREWERHWGYDGTLPLKSAPIIVVAFTRKANS